MFSGYARYQPLIAGWLVALALVASGAAFVKRVWLDRSMVPPPAGLYAGGLWGGRTAEQAKPPRIFLDNDPYYWINYARRMVAERTWRIRHTDVDNAPFGREVHWSSSYAWWMIATGYVSHVVTGQPIQQTIESASVWSDPLLFLIVLAIFGLVVAWQRTSQIGALAIIALASLGPVVWDFGYGRPDHHGLHAFAALGLLSCFIFSRGGWAAREPVNGAISREVAARWFIVSGIFAGVGLWIGATQQIVIIASLAAGALAAMVVSRFFSIAPRHEHLATPSYDPTLWRLWGRSASITAFVFYAIEYLPNHISMHLEVNHPIYILGLVCGGEAMVSFGQWLVLREKLTLQQLARFALACAGLALVPAVLFLGPPEWHSLRDPYMRRLHANIIEFQPFFELTGFALSQRIIRFSQAFGGFPFLFALALWLGFRRRVKLAEMIPLGAAFLPAILLFGISLAQVRWSGLCGAAMIALGLALEPMIRRLVKATLRPRFSAAIIVALLMMPSLVSYLLITWDRSRLLNARGPTQDLARMIATRDVALNLRRYLRLGSIRVMSSATETPVLYHFGGVAGVASLYWENVAGAHDMADFFADATDEVARRIVQTRGITHVLVESNSSAADTAYFLKYGKVDHEEVKKTLGYRLADPTGKIPAWLEPMPYYASPMAAAFHLRLFRVVDEAR